jgi:peroxiredoxin
MSSTITVGQAFPAVTLKTVSGGEITEQSTGDLFGHGRHVLFALPGAFTPTCSAKHLPGFVTHFDEIKAKGVASIACLSVNDAFVMKAWAAANGSPDIIMLADGNGTLTAALGLELDATGFGMGHRSQRFALVINDGKIEHLFVEAPGSFSVSSAEHVLAAL